MDWIDVASKFGVPIAFLVALLWGFWQSCKWIANNAVKPIVEAHTAYLKQSTDLHIAFAKDLSDANEQNMKRAIAMANSLGVIQDADVRAATSLAQIVAILPNICRAPQGSNKKA